MEYLLSGTHTEFNTNVCHGFYYCKNIRPWLLSKCIKNTQQVPITYVLPQPMNRTCFRTVLAVVTQCMLGCCWILWTANSNISKCGIQAKKLIFFVQVVCIKSKGKQQNSHVVQGRVRLPVPLLCFSSFHPTLHPSIRPFPSFRRTVNIWTSLFDCCEKQALSARKLDAVSQYEATNLIAMRAKLPSIWFAEIN